MSKTISCFPRSQVTTRKGYLVFIKDTCRFTCHVCNFWYRNANSILTETFSGKAIYGMYLVKVDNIYYIIPHDTCKNLFELNPQAYI